MKKNFLKFSKFLVIALFIWILIFSLFIQSKYVYDDSPAFIKTNIFNYIAIFINFITILGTYFLCKKTKINIKYIILAYIILGLIFVFIIQFEPFSDSKKVYEIAMSNFQKHPEYVEKNKNNIPTILLLQFFGIITKTPIGMRIINIFQNVLIAYFTYKVAEQLFNKKDKFYLAFTLINIPIFLYINSIYNNIPYALLSIYTIYIILKPNKGKLDLTLAVFASAFAFMLRPVYIINIIAIIMYEIINKKEYKFAIIFLILTIILIILFNFVIELRFGKLENSYPVWSFIQMGFNEEEFGFQNNSHSSDFTYQDVINKLKNLGPKKILEIIIKKETWMFTEGTYQASRYSFGEPNVKYTMENFLTEDLKKIVDSVIRKTFEYLMRGQYFIIILASLISLIKNKDEKISILNYIIIGMFCFYIFWEIKSRYIYVLYPILSIYAANGIEQIIEPLIKNKYLSIKINKNRE